MSNTIVILGHTRTPLGSFQGELSSVSATELGSRAIEGALKNSGVDKNKVSEVMMGCVLPAGLGQAPARQAALGAGLDSHVPCTTVNKVCGSGMKTVMMGADQLKLNEAKVVVAGGMESMSNAPYLLPKARGGYRMGHGEIKDHMFLDGLEDAYAKKLMGEFGEKCAQHYQFTREQQDEFAIRSLKRAQAATKDKTFAREITPVTFSTRKGEVTVETDELPRVARLDKIPDLRPAFAKDGTITAANASAISDGAAALVLSTEDNADKLGAKPLARIKGYTSFAQAPEWFTTAPVGAMNTLLEHVGWSADDVDVFEINEAFAVVTMAAMKELNLPADKVNIHGGACALGHPLGASGARIIVTLLNALEKTGGKKGVASLCIGGGEATAIAIERL